MSSISEKTERISALEFLKRIEDNPSWAKSLEHPVVVYQYVDLSDSNITHLSRWLRFSGKDDYGESANFCRCTQLENAEGTYDGSVDFSQSSIKHIGRLKVLGVDRSATSAYFYKCKELKKLSGTFYGPVAACESSIEEIENLKITKQNRKGEKLDLSCTLAAQIDDKSCQSLMPEQIVWDEHIDDIYKEAINQALEDFQAKKLHQEALEKTSGFQASLKSEVIEESKKTIVKTIAEAIGADDILVKKNVALTSPKRRALLKVSTLLTALVALFLYKTTDELTKQVLIDPTVAAIRKTPELIINWSDPGQKMKNETIWPHEFTPALERYAQSPKTQEDKLALARDTILIMGLDPQVLVVDSHYSVNIPRPTEIANNVAPINISHFEKNNETQLSIDQPLSADGAQIAKSALQSLSAFEELMPDFKNSEIEIIGPSFAMPTTELPTINPSKPLKAIQPKEPEEPAEDPNKNQTPKSPSRNITFGPKDPKVLEESKKLKDLESSEGAKNTKRRTRMTLPIAIGID